MCVCEREKECVCVCVRERKTVRVCLCAQVNVCKCVGEGGGRGFPPKDGEIALQPPRTSGLLECCMIIALNAQQTRLD